MLSQKEIEFINHWESVRVKYSSLSSKLIRGLPMALLFSFPIFFSLVLVYFLSPEWYTKISQKASGEAMMIVLSLLIIVIFFSFARMHFNWEMNEQAYTELIEKKKRHDNSTDFTNSKK
jgi:hypothetical protein